MMGKTHLAVGIATAMVITQPRTKTEIIVATIGGAIGGIMSDIDVKIDNSNKYAQKASLDALYGEITAIILTIALLFSDYLTGGGICKLIIENPTVTIIGAVGLIVLIVLGELSSHRDRTHSLLFMLLFTIAVGLINIPIGIAFFFGYASHLIIDLLNKSPERLFYPLKKGICFKICYADCLGNELLFAASVGIIGLYLAMGLSI